MKREQLILQTMSDTQLDHAKRLLDREAKRRSDAPPAKKASGKSGQHRIGADAAQGNGRKKTGTHN